jgi:hypothetical protein
MCLQLARYIRTYRRRAGRDASFVRWMQESGGNLFDAKRTTTFRLVEGSLLAENQPLSSSKTTRTTGRRDHKNLSCFVVFLTELLL